MGHLEELVLDFLVIHQLNNETGNDEEHSSLLVIISQFSEHSYEPYRAFIILLNQYLLDLGARYRQALES